MVRRMLIFGYIQLILLVLITCEALTTSRSDLKVGSFRTALFDRTLTTSDTNIQVLSSDATILQSNSQIEVSGSGFQSTSSLEFVFDPLLKVNVEYNLGVMSDTKIFLTKRGLLQWPVGELFITTVIVDGISYSTNTGGRGVKVASILANPSVISSNADVHITQTPLISIRGSVFSDIAATTVRTSLDPSNYAIHSVTNSQIDLLLNAGRKWSYQRMDDLNYRLPITISGIDTGFGLYNFELPVVIGTLVKDIDGAYCNNTCVHALDGLCQDPLAYWAFNRDINSSHECATGSDCTDCGGVDVITSAMVDVTPDHSFVYQSALNQSIVVNGVGFSGFAFFEFDPPLELGIDYTMDTIVSSSSVTLRLVAEKKWPLGEVKIISIHSRNSTGYYSREGLDIVIATVLADPQITESNDDYQISGTPLIEVEGTGLGREGKPTLITLQPTRPTDYWVVIADYSKVVLELRNGSNHLGWLPPKFEFSEDATRVPLQVVSINTGAGEVVFAEPVTIGYIVEDIPEEEADDIEEVFEELFPMVPKKITRSGYIWYFVGILLTLSVLLSMIGIQYCVICTVRRFSREESAIEMTKYSSVPQFESDKSF